MFLTNQALAHGDYSYFASKVECLFHNSVIVALDEYGIPIQLGIKLEEQINLGDDLDNALEIIKKTDPNQLKLHPFEKEVLSYVIEGVVNCHFKQFGIPPR